MSSNNKSSFDSFLENVTINDETLNYYAVDKINQEKYSKLSELTFWNIIR
jgi:hypothetical protein